MDARDAGGRTPLWAAVEHYACAKLLLDAGTGARAHRAPFALAGAGDGTGTLAGIMAADAQAREWALAATDTRQR